MKPTMTALALIVVATGVPAASSADDESGHRENAGSMRQQSREAAEAIRNYSVEQRDKAVSSAQRALQALDARMGRLAADIDRKWDQLDESARGHARDTMDRLRMERGEAAEWLGALKQSTREAWDDARDGFARSYQSLKDNLDKAKEEM